MCERFACHDGQTALGQYDELREKESGAFVAPIPRLLLLDFEDAIPPYSNA